MFDKAKKNIKVSKVYIHFTHFCLRVEKQKYEVLFFCFGMQPSFYQPIPCTACAGGSERNIWIIKSFSDHLFLL